MLERIVVIRFKEEYRSPERLAEIAEHSRKVMPGVPGVREVTVGTAADDATAGAWDLVLVVRLDGMEAIPAYRDDPGHRAYVDDYLRPRMDSIAAWNFEVP